jgi:hypothetical protein
MVIVIDVRLLQQSQEVAQLGLLLDKFQKRNGGDVGFFAVMVIPRVRATAHASQHAKREGCRHYFIYLLESHIDWTIL